MTWPEATAAVLVTLLVCLTIATFLVLRHFDRINRIHFWKEVERLATLGPDEEEAEPQIPQPTIYGTILPMEATPGTQFYNLATNTLYVRTEESWAIVRGSVSANDDQEDETRG